MSYTTPWRSLGDSNPCFRRERATSWAARRRERPIRNSRDNAAVQAALQARNRGKSVSGLAGKAQPTGLLERLDVESSQFIGAVDLDQHGKTARRGRGRDQARAFG